MRKLFSYTAVSLLLGSALVSAHTGHDHSEMAAKKTEEHQHPKAEKQATIKISLVKQEDQVGKKLTQIKLTKITDDQPVALNDLKEAHTQKVHLLIVDDSLTDYHHIHPEATKEPGVYQFEWTPKAKGSYKLWADLVPVATNEQQYVTFDLIKGEKGAPIDKNVSLQSTVEGYTFKLSFDQDKLVAGKPVMGKIIVTDAKGDSVKTLEPIMAAYAHIVGFSEGLQSVVHIHPMGDEPTKETDRGGPELEFHLEPSAPGFIKLFAQVKLNGKELFVPFGINIESN
jgi:hypothetical protein